MRSGHMRIGASLIFLIAIGVAAFVAAPRAEAGTTVYFGFGHYFGDYDHHGYWHHRHYHGYWRHWHPRPRYYGPPVYYDDDDYDDDVGEWHEPAPAVPAPSAVSPPTAPAPYCREYTTTVVIDGVEQQAYGTACRQDDGSWQIIN